MSGSIAIMTDTAHLASDLIGFGISIMAIKMAQRPADQSLSYGWHRAEIMGTVLSIVFLWGLTTWLLWEATKRVINSSYELNGPIMLLTAVGGLLFNIIQLKVLGHGHHHGHDHGGHDHGHDHGHSHGAHDHGH